MYIANSFRFILLSAIVFCFIGLSFPWSIIPFPGQLLKPILETINKIWIPVFGNDCIEIHSDSLGMRLSFLHMIIFSLGINSIFHRLIAKYQDRIMSWIEMILLYLIIYFLLKYGLDKIFKNQFPFPEPNILFSPVANLSKGMLYWSSVGSSYSFNIITGAFECLCALLLIWNKTRMVGLLLSLLIFGQIVLINFTFAIDVKLLSSLLFFSSLLLLLSYKARLLSLFNTHNTIVLLPVEKGLENHKPKRVQIKIFVLMLIFLDVFYPFVTTKSFNNDNNAVSPMVGAYRITDNNFNLGELEQISHCFVNSKGYVIFQNSDFQTLCFEIKITTNLVHTKLKFPVNFSIFSKKHKTYILVTEDGARKEIELKRLNLQKIKLSN
jgi:hypothetical protein